MYQSINVTVMKLDVVCDDADYVLGEQRVASPEARSCDVTNIESRFGHVITEILRQHTTSSVADRLDGSG